MRVRASAAVAVFLFVLVGARSAATAPPSDFADSLVVEVAGPTAVAFTPDGRMLIATQTGPLRVFDGTALLSQPALDLTVAVCTSEEDGLLGVAVDPAFASNGYIYVYYTHSSRGSCFNRVSRFTMSGNIANAGTELVLIDGIPATGGYHNAGDVQFGKDGYLYIGVGDGGCDYTGDSGCGGANDASRDENALVGKILRITSTGGIPPTNPFQGAGTTRCSTGTATPGLKCQETFARGLRNPFRMAFDPNADGTRFFINDVGQNVWEEIDEGQPAADFGWNVREGHCANGSTTDCSAPPPGMTDPVFDYDHSSGCSAITGGAFVPHGVWPSSYDGTYIYGDYVCGKLFVLEQNGGVYTSTEFAAGAGSPVDVRFGPYGATQALYYTNYVNGGQVRRIAYTGSANRAPTAALSATPTSGPAPLAVSLDAAGSSDPDPGDTLTYTWAFGDGSPTAQTSAPTTSHTYAAGTFTASVVATDNHGAASAPATVRIDSGNAPPQPSIDSPSPSYQFGVGDTITLRGSATDAEDGTLPGTSLSWTVIRHHATHTHPFLPPTIGASVNFPGPEPEDLAAAANSYLEVFLTATDSRGLSKTVSLEIQPAKVDITLATNPVGLRLEANGATAPSTFVSWKNWAFTVNAPDQTDGSGKEWTFSSWSDAGSRSHTIVTPAVPSTYTATYVAVPEPSSGIVAAYGFEEGSGTSTADASGNGNAGVLSATSWVTAGKFGSALSFDGSSSRVSVNDAPSLDLTDSLTIEAWVSPRALSNWNAVALKERTGGIVYSLYANDVSDRPVGQLDIDGEQNAYGTGTLPPNSWTHLASSWDGNTLRLYVNGIQVGTKAVSGTLANSSGPFSIGGNEVWGEHFSGLIDELRLYNRALSATEVQADMQRAVSGSTPPDTQPPTAPGNLQTSTSNTTVNLTWAAATDNASGIARYHLHRSTTPGFTPSSSNEIATPTTTSYSDSNLAPGNYHYKVTAEDGSNNIGPPSNEATATIQTPPPTNGLIAAYGFEEGTGTTTADASGNNNGGSLTGGVAWSPNGYSGRALSFDGVDDIVTIADAPSLRFTTELTVEAWVRPSQLGDSYRTVVLKERNGGLCYGLYAHTSGTGPSAHVFVADAEPRARSSSTLAANIWTHLAMTFDSATIRLYVDGTLTASAAASGSVTTSTGVLRIGGNDVWSEWFAGLIDDVRIYNRALTATEIQSDMQRAV